jgi:hypothetical protein
MYIAVFFMLFMHAQNRQKNQFHDENIRYSHANDVYKDFIQILLQSTN